MESINLEDLGDFGTHAPIQLNPEGNALIRDLIYCKRCGFLLWGPRVGRTERSNKDCVPTILSLRWST